MNASPDRTAVFPHLFVGGKDSEKGFDGLVIDGREESPTDSRIVHVPAFRGRGEGWTTNPTLAQRAVDLIANQIGEGRNVLVRCGSGVERSPTIAVLYLVRKQGLTPSEAYARIRAVRPQVIEEFDILSLTYEERTR